MACFNSIGSMSSGYIFLILFVTFLNKSICTPEEERGVIYASRCEVCKIITIELMERFKKTGKSRDVIELGYSLDNKDKKKFNYVGSELGFTEYLEDICEGILEYNLHKERKDSTRFAKGRSETFQTLHGLVDRGVKVELDIPYELWDSPPAEVTEMKHRCEDIIERYEDDIRDWYFNYRNEKTLQEFLCVDRVLRKDDTKCLDEVIPEKTDKKTKSEL